MSAEQPGEELDQVGIVVGIPSRGQVHIAWALMFSTLEWPVGATRATVLTVGTEISHARNNIAGNALDRGAKYLFFIDDDVQIPNFAPRRMIYQMEQHPEWDLLSGVYVTKTTPPEPLIFGGEKAKMGAFWDWRCGETFPIWGCGMGCAVIRVSAFERMKDPWFAWTQDRDGVNSGGEGEDIYFCNRLAEIGGTLMCDGSILCGHINAETGQMFRLWEDSLPFRNALPEFLADPASGMIATKPVLDLHSDGRGGKPNEEIAAIDEEETQGYVGDPKPKKLIVPKGGMKGVVGS